MLTTFYIFSISKLMKSDVFKIITGVFLVFLFIVLYAIEFSFISRTFEVSGLIGRSVVVGILMGCGLGYFVTRYADELLEKVQYFIMVLVLSILITPLFGAMSNRLLAGKPETKNFEFIQEEPYGASRFGIIEGQEPTVDGYFIFFVKDGQFERIKSPVPKFPNKEKGDQIQLAIRNGLWGYEFVDL